ncbi:MAG: SGNH/GDSL hydrolase family protein [Polyangiaceae bacterium]
MRLPRRPVGLEPRRFSGASAIRASFLAALGVIAAACIKVEITGIIPDEGGAPTGGTGGTGGAGGSGGSGGVLVPMFQGGRHPATWRVGKTPITGDVPGWFIPKTAERIKYPTDRQVSPITASVAEHLRNVALHGTNLADNVFMKVGDSISDSEYYLNCFKGDINNQAPTREFNIVWGGYSALAEAVFHFRSAKIGMTSPFDRKSATTRVGAAVTFPLEGDPPTPFEQEFTALSPQFAGTMYGTNDLGVGGSARTDLGQKIRPYQKGLVTLVDTMLARGIVPWLSTIPPRIDDPQYMEIVPLFNAVVRGLAEGRQIPLVDFNRDLLAAPFYGLGENGDGVHPNTLDYNTACHFDTATLAYGYNIRNLGALTTLDRLMKVVVDGVASLDDTAPTLAGEGNAASPFVIDALPFSDMRSTRDATANAIMDYSGCAGSKPGRGSEYWYRLDLTAATPLRAVVLDGSVDHGPADGPVDVDVYLLDATRSGPGCLKSADAVIEGTIGPGTFYIVVDTTGAGAESAGEFTLSVVPCASTDERCGTAVNAAAKRH